MGVSQKIQEDLSGALKHKDDERVSVLRMIKTSLTNAEIAKRPEKLTEKDEISILRSEVKKRRDSIASYKQGGREDLASKEAREIEIIGEYLPAEMGDEELKKIISGVMEKTGAQGPKDFGKVMGAVMKEAQGKADGSRISAMLKELLQ